MQNVIVTGGAQGIGEAIARLLYPSYRVIILDQKEPKHGYYHHFYVCDLSSKAALLATIETLKAGFDNVYALINNAGIFDQTALEEQSLTTWEKIIAVNLQAPYVLAQAFAPLLTQSHGHIVNIASTRAIMSEPGTEAYSASKGGLVALSHALAQSLSGSVSVNAISPGWINTDETYQPTDEEDEWHASGRVGRSSDIAEMVVFLLARNDGFITGSHFVIDGGVSRKMVYPS